MTTCGSHCVLAWMAENNPSMGEMAERLREGLRKAGVPEA
jgi:hypothetical protein